MAEASYWTEGKLLILYLLERLGFDIPRASLEMAALKMRWLTFFDLQQSLGELEQSGLITLYSRDDQAMVRLAEAGREALPLFVGKLSHDQIDRAETFLRDHRAQLRRASQAWATYQVTGEGQVSVVMKMAERDLLLMEVVLNLPDEQQAAQMVERFADRADDAYQALIKVLGEDISSSP